MENEHGIPDFDQQLLSMLTVEEGNIPFAYADSEGIPSIGVGVNLRVPENLQKVLSEFGLTTFKPGETPAWVKSIPDLSADDIANITQNEYNYFVQIRDAVEATYSPTPALVINHPGNSVASILNNILAKRAASRRVGCPFAPHRLSYPMPNSL